MAEWVIPVELETGVPLPIMPPSDGLPLPGIQGYGANWHHAVYPEHRKEHASDSGQALRQVRVEWSDIGDHRSYHHYFDEYMAEKWEFPHSIHQRFGMTVIMAAGYVPTQAIRIEKSGPSYVTLGDRERHNIQKAKILKVAGDVPVYEFLRAYVLKQKLDGVVPEVDIKTFLTTNDEILRNQLGDDLLKAAAEIATRDIKPLYTAAYKKKLLTPDVPVEPSELIISEPTMLGTDKRRRKARTSLRLSLAKQLGIELPEAA